MADPKAEKKAALWVLPWAASMVALWAVLKASHWVAMWEQKKVGLLAETTDWMKAVPMVARKGGRWAASKAGSLVG